MTVEQIKYLPAHIAMMDIQNAQGFVVPFDVGGESYTLIDGRVLACYGAEKSWEGRWMAWAVLSRHVAPHMLTLTRYVKEVMKRADGRLEITVESDFSEGMRWAKMLGFELEAERMKSFKDGKDYALWARVS